MFPLVIDESALDGGLAAAEPSPLGGLPALVPEGPAPVVLRVSGGKPMRMEAVLLVEAEAPPAGEGGIGHALRLYRRAGGDVVVALRTAGGDGGFDRVEIFPDLEEAATWLEGFDPTADLAIDLDASDRALSAVEVALRAAALRIRGDAAVRRYRGVVGEALYRLETAP